MKDYKCFYKTKTIRLPDFCSNVDSTEGMFILFLIYYMIYSTTFKIHIVNGNKHKNQNLQKKIKLQKRRIHGVSTTERNSSTS